MKGKSFYVILLVVVWLLVGCVSSSVRFTHEEIEGYPLDVQEKIIKGEVYIGMTRRQVRYAWGAPDRVRTLDPLNGKAREEWIYTKLFGVYEEKRLLFLEDILTYIIPEPKKTQK
jgi:hypothetical protein